MDEPAADVIEALVEAASAIDITPELLARVPAAVERVNALRRTWIANGNMREDSQTNDDLGVVTVAATWAENGLTARAEEVAAQRRISADIRAEMLAINTRYQGTTEAATGYLDGLNMALELVESVEPQHKPAGDPMTFSTYCVLDDYCVPTTIQWALIFDQRQYGPFPTKQAATVYGHALYTALPGDHEFETTPLITPTADLLQR